MPEAIWLDVDDPVLRLALRHVAAELGLEAVGRGSAGAVRVADQVPGRAGPIDVLAVPASPLGCRIALGAVVSGVTTAVISARQPEDLGGALEAIRQQLVSVPVAILSQAHRLPDLSRRDHQILGCLAAGILRDSAIARRLEVSLATVKRNVNELYDRVPAPGRHDLASVARDLGYTGLMSSGVLSLATAVDLRNRRSHTPA